MQQQARGGAAYALPSSFFASSPSQRMTRLVMTVLMREMRALSCMCSRLMLSGISAQSITPRTKRRKGGSTLPRCHTFRMCSCGGGGGRAPTHPPVAVALDQHAACIQRHPALLLALKHVVGGGGNVEQRANVNRRISSEVEAGGGEVAGVGDELRKSSEARRFIVGRRPSPGRT